MQVCKSLRIEELSCAFQEIRPFLDGLENSFKNVAPVVAALSDNPGLATSTQNIHAGTAHIKSKAWLVQLKFKDSVLKGWLTGIFFEESDLVDIVYDGDKIYAIYSPERHLLVMKPRLQIGWRFQVRTGLKVFKWVAVGISVLAALAFLLLNLTGSEPFSSFLIELPFIILFAAFISALIVWATSRKDLNAARLATRVFKAVGLKDPENLIIATKEHIRNMQPGPGYYFDTTGLDSQQSFDPDRLSN